MLRSSSWLILASLSIGGNAYADIVVAQTDDAHLSIGGLAQLTGIAEYVDDTQRDNDKARAYIFMGTARLRISGDYKNFGFYTELALGGEAAVNATTGVSLDLLDLYFTVPLTSRGNTRLQIGQFKVPYGREWLTYEGNLNFSERSLDTLGFQVGRDVGIALVSEPKPFTAILGVFTGGGRDVPAAHELPERLGFPLVVARLGVGNMDEKPFFLEQSEFHPESTKMAFSIGGLFTKDSLIGHSTVLNVKLADKGLLTDSNWNPYIAQAPLRQGYLWQAEADAVLRKPLGPLTLNAEVQADYGGYSNAYGHVQMFGGRAQAGLAWQPFTATVRYSFLVPDSKFAANGVSLTNGRVINEITPSLAYDFYKHLRLVLEVPVLVQIPVFTEKGVGAYVASDLPDETSVVGVKGGTVASSIVAGARLMFQGQF